MHQFQHQRRHAVGVTGNKSVLYRRLGHVVRLVPGGSPRVQPRNLVRISDPELGLQELAQQMVVSVPLAASVEWNDEEIAALHLLEQSRGSNAADNRVAERP